MCEALESLKVALVGKHPVVAMDCPKCKFPHLDILSGSDITPQSLHRCLACDEEFKIAVKAVSNPLAWLSPVLADDRIFFTNLAGTFRTISRSGKQSGLL